MLGNSMFSFSHDVCHDITENCTIWVERKLLPVNGSILEKAQILSFGNAEDKIYEVKVFSIIKRFS